MTTWHQRFTQALSVLCGGKEPPAQAVMDWLDPAMDDFKLQEWAIEHSVLGWTQGVAIIDAAHTLADQPAEGCGHAEFPHTSTGDEA